jgi:hypothetical protein
MLHFFWKAGALGFGRERDVISARILVIPIAFTRAKNE